MVLVFDQSAYISLSFHLNLQMEYFQFQAPIIIHHNCKCLLQVHHRNQLKYLSIPLEVTMHCSFSNVKIICKISLEISSHSLLCKYENQKDLAECSLMTNDYEQEAYEYCAINLELLPRSYNNIKIYNLLTLLFSFYQMQLKFNLIHANIHIMISFKA